MISFYGDPLTPHVGCTQTAVAIAAVTQNVCMSRRWKYELVPYGRRKQPLSSFTHLVPVKPDHSSVCTVCPESFQHLVLTLKSRSYQTVHQNRPYE
jgi:hypothetical protein